jgi:hypothetical protein
MFGVLLFGVMSCASHYTLQSPNDVALLPASHGVNGGSFVAVTDWQYRGSDGGFHYFKHYYNIDNTLRSSAVRIPRSAVILDFPEHEVQNTGEWVRLDGKNSNTFEFALSPGHQHDSSPIA